LGELYEAHWCGNPPPNAAASRRSTHFNQPKGEEKRGVSINQGMTRKAGRWRLKQEQRSPQSPDGSRS
jgi:hypothetical protein